MSVKSGYITIIGKPNVGKSTLLNAFLGEKLSITTNKPQTTRKRVMGILSTDTYQVIFLDTPGILKPDYLLQEKMLEYILQSVKDADILLFIIDITADPEGKKTLEDENVKKILAVSRKKKIVLLNKVDLSNEEKVKALMSKLEKMEMFDRIFPVSALLNYNTDNVMASILEFLPEHPKYFPDDRLTDEPERFFVSEIIREKILEQFHDEVPYSTEVVIDDFKEREGRKDFIQAAIIVEKESQKPIIIGKQGTAIKVLGQRSREAIEAFLQRPVFLELRVKVRNKWRSDPNYLKSFGYSTDEE
ncbi:MAG: GTPase Era [Ignavibacteriales bacterium]